MQLPQFLAWMQVWLGSYAGRPSTQYVATDTFANLVTTYANAAYANCKLKASDIGPYGTDMVVDPVTYAIKPANGSALWARSAVQYGIMPAGTFGTGSSGHFTSGTAFPHALTNGAWMYFPANVLTTPNITAGLYWVVASSTTVFTVYQSGPGSSAFNFSVGGASDGTTAEITFVSMTQPAYLYGLNGGIEVEYLQMHNNSAGAKIFGFRPSASVARTMNATTSTTIRNALGMMCKNSHTVKLSQSINSFKFGNSGTSTGNAEYTLDTSVSNTISLTGQLSVATDLMVMDSYRITLLG